MEISVIASSKDGYLADKSEFDRFSGRCAGVCYMRGTFDEIVHEDIEKTEKRVRMTKLNGHHSVYDHLNISLYLDGVPKIIAMVLNNEHQYTTSEKSGRYTKLNTSQKEEIVFNKWFEIFKNKIKKLYQAECPTYFTDSRIEKLAFENARYTTSVFSTASMVYTTTYRQFNVLISLIEDYLSNEPNTPFEIKFHESLKELLDKFKALPYYDSDLCKNEKHRHLSLFSNAKVEEYFGDVYATTYQATFSSFAHLHRHRTIDYNIKVLDGFYYIPEMIRDSDDLTKLWLDDLRDLNNFPQATMLEVNEMGNLDNFILKLKERKCTAVLLETNRVTNETLKKYVRALQVKAHNRYEDLERYTHGSRCTFPDYKCPSPCGFKAGIDETRIV